MQIKKRKRSRAPGIREDGMPVGTPRPVDVHVGSRVRLRRVLIGLSQEKLGEAVGLTFQQIQKYERGANRIGASRLWEFSQILDVPVSFFFDDMPGGIKDQENQRVAGFSDKSQAPFEPDPLARRETLELVRAYYRVTELSVRKRLFELTKSIAAAESGEDD